MVSIIANSNKSKQKRIIVLNIKIIFYLAATLYCFNCVLDF